MKILDLFKSKEARIAKLRKESEGARPAVVPPPSSPRPRPTVAPSPPYRPRVLDAIRDRNERLRNQ